MGGYPVVGDPGCVNDSSSGFSEFVGGHARCDPVPRVHALLGRRPQLRLAGLRGHLVHDGRPRLAGWIGGLTVDHQAEGRLEIRASHQAVIGE